MKKNLFIVLSGGLASSTFVLFLVLKTCLQEILKLQDEKFASPVMPNLALFLTYLILFLCIGQIINSYFCLRKNYSRRDATFINFFLFAVSNVILFSISLLTILPMLVRFSIIQF